jgi:hippurate hydrolase
VFEVDLAKERHERLLTLPALWHARGFHRAAGPSSSHRASIEPTRGRCFRAASALQNRRLKMAVTDRISQLHAEMTRWRRDLHAHPELGFQETRTSALVAGLLEEFGCDEVHRGVGRTGVVGTLRAGRSTRSLGLRADMDALPMGEANDFEHRSRHEGRMHACGHDGHTAMLLGAAKYLAQTRDFDGVVHFIFQPAEEGLGGAQAMISDGLFERFPCEAIFGMHNRPGLPVGKFAVRSGPMMAGGGFFDIEITGKGAHGARPESGIDPVLVASHIAVALQSIVSRNVPPTETAVVSVTKIQGGDAYNVIPQTARLAGISAFARGDGVDRARLPQIAAGAQAFGAQAHPGRFIFAHRQQPGRSGVRGASAARWCAERRAQPPLIMAPEDFSFMLETVLGHPSATVPARAPAVPRRTTSTTTRCRWGPASTPGWSKRGWRGTKTKGNLSPRRHEGKPNESWGVSNRLESHSARAVCAG